MKSLIRDVYSYLKYHEEINHYYSYGLEESYIGDDTFDWRERLHLWLKAE